MTNESANSGRPPAVDRTTYYFRWQPGAPAAQQCEGCTWCATQVAELSYLHSREDLAYSARPGR